jgi:hypothetical protein
MRDEVKAFKQLKLSFHPSSLRPHPFFCCAGVDVCDNMRGTSGNVSYKYEVKSLGRRAGALFA